MEVAAPLPAESGHWYRRDGSPCYTVPAKNGGERATTLRDARVMDLVPSVTTIIRCAAAPGLERWKAEQLLLAALTMPQVEGETEADWRARVQKDSQEQARKAADRGTEIHAAIEKYYGVGWNESDMGSWKAPYARAFVEAVRGWFGSQDWRPEKSFAHPLGFGGKVDLHSDSVLLDIKTKDSLDGVKVYDEHLCQLAAYLRGIRGHDHEYRTGIVFVHRTEPKVTICEVSQDELDRGWRMFSALLDYWYACNGLRRAA